MKILLVVEEDFNGDIAEQMMDHLAELNAVDLRTLDLGLYRLGPMQRLSESGAKLAARFMFTGVLDELVLYFEQPASAKMMDALKMASIERNIPVTAYDWNKSGQTIWCRSFSMERAVAI